MTPCLVSFPAIETAGSTRIDNGTHPMLSVNGTITVRTLR